MTLKVADMFSGIGGFRLGLEATGGFETVVFCEKDTFCQQVLTKHWPDTPIIGDIHDVTADTLRQHNIGKIDVLTAGFNCQPFSDAGKKRGILDERFLWPELFRVIGLLNPRYIILENVRGLLTTQKGLAFTGILYDLSAAGYDAEWQIIPASGVGAPHQRERVFVVAYHRRERIQRVFRSSVRRQSAFKAFQDVRGVADLRNRSAIPEPLIWGASDGVSNWAHRLSALGNSVVPQVVAYVGDEILKAIQTAEMKEYHG